ncbi:hypothetical protein HD554DRAFT_2203154 [Boletus coccyginus]|nr:hypothetical protein HD554DRAFT_2203154 [Boletus coccyginus]
MTPFHQNFHDVICHVIKVYFHASWMAIGDVETLEALQSKSFTQLHDLAKEIVDKLASSAAIDAIDTLPKGQHDVLQYIDFYEAMKNGDVEIMEFILPHFAFHFAGRYNFNYLGEFGKFLSLDKMQKYNIKAIKGPAISTLYAVQKHLKHQIRSLYCGSSHGDPSHAKDVSQLEDAYISSNIHIEEQGCAVHTEVDIVQDIITHGAVGLATKNTIAQWWMK